MSECYNSGCQHDPLTAEAVDGGQPETMVRIAEARDSEVELIHESMVDIDRTMRVEWRVNKRTVIEEIGEGLYTIADWHRLDMNGLKRVAAVIGAIMRDARTAKKVEG